MQDNVISIDPESTMVDALTIMDEKSVRMLPVLDSEKMCRGLVSVFKASKFICPTFRDLGESRRVKTSIKILSRTLRADVVHAETPETPLELFLVVASMSEDSFAERISQMSPAETLIIVDDREQILEHSIRADVRVIIVTGGLKISKAIEKLTREHRVTLLISPHDTVTTTLLCRAAVPIRHMVHSKFLSFGIDESLAEIQPIAAASNFQAFPVVNDQGETVGILSKSDFLKPVERQLILVDHNELSQAVKGADKVDIVEIIDHHRIGTFTSKQPMLFRNEPVGSTSSIVADCFFRDQIELSPQIAGLLLAGLVTDTLNLTSPTTTARDEHILRRLEEIAGVDANSFTERLFASGSVLTSLPAKEAIVADCKEFKEQNNTFSVAQIEEIGFHNFWAQKQDLLEALENYRAQQSYFFSALLVTDIVRTSSLLLVAGPNSFKQQITEKEKEPGIYSLPGIVSRKKQLLPYLTRCLKSNTTE